MFRCPGAWNHSVHCLLCTECVAVAAGAGRFPSCSYCVSDVGPQWKGLKTNTQQNLLLQAPLPSPPPPYNPTSDDTSWSMFDTADALRCHSTLCTATVSWSMMRGEIGHFEVECQWIQIQSQSALECKCLFFALEYNILPRESNNFCEFSCMLMPMM